MQMLKNKTLERLVAKYSLAGVLSLFGIVVLFVAAFFINLVLGHILFFCLLYYWNAEQYAKGKLDGMVQYKSEGYELGYKRGRESMTRLLPRICPKRKTCPGRPHDRLDSDRLEIVLEWIDGATLKSLKEKHNIHSENTIRNWKKEFEQKGIL